MSYRDLLDASITEPMPPFESVDSLIARERRAQRRRRFAATGAAGLGVVAVLVAVTVISGTPTASAPPIGATIGPATGTPSPTVEPSLSAHPELTSRPLPAPEPDRDTLRALTETVKAHLSDLLPKSTFTRSHPGYEPDFPPLEVGVERGEGVPEGAGYRNLTAFADFSGPDGVGSIDVLIGRVDDGQPHAEWCITTGKPDDGGPCNSWYDVSGVLDVITDCDQRASDDKRTCKEATGPHGEGIVTLTGNVSRGGGAGRVEYRIDVTRPDGTALIVMCRNWMRVGGAGGSGPPALRVVDLVTIALDPRLAAPR